MISDLSSIVYVFLKGGWFEVLVGFCWKFSVNQWEHSFPHIRLFGSTDGKLERWSLEVCCFWVISLNRRYGGTWRHSHGWLSPCQGVWRWKCGTTTSSAWTWSMLWWPLASQRLQSPAKSRVELLFQAVVGRMIPKPHGEALITAQRTHRRKLTKMHTNTLTVYFISRWKLLTNETHEAKCLFTVCF